MTMLLESGARPYRPKAGMATSVVLHVALIGAAVVGTTRVVLPPREKVEEHAVLYVAPKPPPEVHLAPKPLPPAPKTRQAPPRPVPAPPRMQPPQPKAPVLVAPTKIATAIPAPDLKAIPTAGDVVAAPPAAAGPPAGKSEGAGKDGESGAGKGNGGPSHEDGSAFSEAQVERAVEVVRNAQPKYPEIARNAGIQGVVAVRFIVGTDGRVEGGSIDVLSTPHDAFVAAVRAALLSTRYRPAEVGGRPVRQLVEQSFTFRLDR